MPDIKFDFSRVSYSGVLEVAAPIVPGAILAFGTLILNPALAARLLSSPFLGYKTRVVAGILLFYIAGLLLNLLINYVSYTLGYIIGQIFGKKLFPNPPTPWRNVTWRRTARIFLGNDLAPATDELYFKYLDDAAKEQLAHVQDPQARAALENVVQAHFSRSIADGEWFWWYEILGKYFTVGQWWAPPWQYFAGMLHTTSWAVVLLMVLNHRHHWFAWLLCSTAILFGTLIAWFAGGVFLDPQGVNQAAMLLRIIKPHPSK
jgi:hypothetical protein